MDTPEPTVSYWPRRTLLVVMLTGSLLPAAACIWLIDAGLFAGRLLGTNVDLTGPRAIRLLGMVPFICIMLYFAALCAYRLWRPQPSLTLKPDGMEIRPFFGSARFVGWEDVTEITIFDYRQNFGKRIEGYRCRPARSGPVYARVKRPQPARRQVQCPQVRISSVCRQGDADGTAGECARDDATLSRQEQATRGSKRSGPHEPVDLLTVEQQVIDYHQARLRLHVDAGRITVGEAMPFDEFERMLRAVRLVPHHER